MRLRVYVYVYVCTRACLVIRVPAVLNVMVQVVGVIPRNSKRHGFVGVGSTQS